MASFDEEDRAMRAAAFAHLRRLQDVYSPLTSAHLKAGFEYHGSRVPLLNPQRGIFKPRQMRYLLSIRTVYPRRGARVWYDDQRAVHQQIYEGDELVEYAFMGDNPDAADNRWLREAMESGVPLIYFLGVAPGRYQAIFPVFIAEWYREERKAMVAFGLPQTTGDKSLTLSDTVAERRYALQTVKQRLHQASFRAAVLQAYGGRCALSGLPEPRLLDAAHIISDGNEPLGQPVVPNGLPLSKIHHAAFDAHLIGVDPDFRVHVSERLREMNDGPMLEALKRLHLQKIVLPNRKSDWPDPARLETRFHEFLRAA